MPPMPGATTPDKAPLKSRTKFGTALLMACLKAGLTQSRLAQEIDVSASRLSQVINGRSILSVELLVLCRDYFSGYYGIDLPFSGGDLEDEYREFFEN